MARCEKSDFVKNALYMSTDTLRLASKMVDGAEGPVQETDKNLLNAHCRGDPAAFGELVRRHGGSLLGYLMRMCANREQAEDFFQETFKRVHEKADTLRKDRFKSWLFSIATRVAIDGLRRRSRLKLVSLNQQFDCNDGGREPLSEIAVADSTHNPVEQAVKAEEARQVREAVASLPAKQRATLVLAYYQQLSYREVAEVLGCSIGTVKSQMFRALRTLAQRLPDISGEGK